MKIEKMKSLWLQNAPKNCVLHLFIERERCGAYGLLNDLIYAEDSRGRFGWHDSGNKDCPKPVTLTPREALLVIRNSGRSPADFYVMESNSNN